MLYEVLIFNTLLIFSIWPAQGESGKCRDGIKKNVSPHQLLRQDLFCSYDKESRPVNDFHQNITVNFRIFVLSFNLDEHKNVLDVYAWLEMLWMDEGLKWNLDDYSNVDVLHVKSYDIWQPDISIFNSGNMETNGAWDYTHCEINSTGVVYCIPYIKWSAQCTANLQQWPFDQHICNMTIGSWSHTGEQIDIKLRRKGISLHHFTSNPEWELLNTTAIKNISTNECCPNTTFQSIDFIFHIKRHADAYAATAVLPSLVLTMFTLASYWLDPKKTNRISVCCVSTICHCLYLQYLGLKLPINGIATPIIILLYRDSLITTCMAFLVAVVAERLPSSSADNSVTTAPIPAWLDRFIGVVMDQKAGQILLLGKFDSKRDGAILTEDGPQSDEDKGKQEWRMLITIIDRLGFLISLIIYFILYIALIPKY